MHQDSLGFFIFKMMIGLAIFFLIAMLYWSSALFENDLKNIQEDLAQVKNNLNLIKDDLQTLKLNDSNGLKLKNRDPEKSEIDFAHPEEKFLSFNSQDNLLKQDPFYRHTLPDLLGPAFKPHGIRKEASIGKPKDLHPFSIWSEVSTWNSLCTVSLAGQKMGKYETYTPNLALSMELRPSSSGVPEYWIALRQDVFWEPLNPRHFPESVQLAPLFLQKHRVTAHDIKFYFDAIMNPHVEEEQAIALRNYYNDVEEIKVIDDFTLVVRWKTRGIKDSDDKESPHMKYLATSFTGGLKPLARFVYQHFSDGTKIIQEDSDPNTYRTNSIWAQNFSHHWAKNIIVSCGPWLFDGMTEREIRFRRNANYYDPLAALVNKYEIKFRDSPDSIWQEFKTGELDLFIIPPNLLTELDQFLNSDPYKQQVDEGLTIKRLDYLSRSYSYIGWNQKNPLFSSSKVRQALTMAIDRERMIRQNLNDMGMQITGTFFPFSPSYDSSLKPYPFDPIQALRLLHEEGWVDSDGDHILDKVINGKKIPFRFTLSYYVKNQTTKAICDYISTTLKEIGIDCILNGVDMSDLSALFEDKNFDAVSLGWTLASPPEDPKQLWYSTGAKEKGSSNAVGFANAEVDQIIDQLEYEYDPKKRIALYHRFDKIIYEEAPYTFLYAPKITLAYRDYLQNVFIPAKKQDLIPGANVGEPESSIFWIK